MQREIKFRAWDGKKMNHEGILDGCYYEFEGGEAMQCRSEYPVMQYTGLKDKNGKEIYEGDVVVCGGSHSIPHEVKYSDEDAAFLVQTNRGDKLGCQEFFDERGYEIIGNIYENPGLLTQSH